MNFFKKSFFILLFTALIGSSSLFLTSCEGTSATPDNNTEQTDDNNNNETTDKSDETETDDSDSNDDSNDTDDPLTALSSVEFAKTLTIGWNLGNTLDANSETGWGAPLTTEAMIKAVHKAGFKTIRIPVSWSYHISASDKTNYKIDSTWMKRVKEVVNYAYNDGMYVIINIHHDNYTPAKLSTTAGFALSDDAAIQTKSKNYISKVWTQIATEFADYDNKLVFEVLNEPRDIEGEVWGNEWWIGPGNGKTICNIITSYEQAGIDAIRAVKGNENRFIMTPGYAASGSDSSILSYYTMPKDSAKDKLILSTHAYSPYTFAMYSSSDPDHTNFTAADKSSLDSIFNNLKTKYIDKGIGVVMGEASASNKGNLSAREEWFTYYFKKAYEKGIPTVLWDNMLADPEPTDSERHGYFNRKELSWYFPTLIENAMKAVGVSGYEIPEYEAPAPVEITWKGDSAATVISNETLDTKWNAVNFAKSKFTNAKKGSVIKFVCSSTSGGKIRLINDSWSVVYNQGTLKNATLSGDDFIVASGNVEVLYSLTEKDAAAWKSSGLYFVCPDLKVTKILFQE